MRMSGKRTTGTLSAGMVLVLLGLCPGRLCAGYEGVELTESGTIVGAVSFEGSVPKAKTLELNTKDEPCHTEPIPSEELVVSDDKKIRWAVASIRKIDRGKPFAAEDPDHPVQLDQKGCRFIPHVVVTPKRRTLRLLNSDGVLHNVHSHAKKNQAFNKAQPPQVKQMDVSFKRPETIRLSCDVHEWMGAWIVVAGHPYYAVTGSDGAFRFEQVPVGTHTIRVWHETLGKQEKDVTVKSGEEAHLEFVFKK